MAMKMDPKQVGQIMAMGNAEFLVGCVAGVLIERLLLVVEPSRSCDSAVRLHLGLLVQVGLIATLIAVIPELMRQAKAPVNAGMVGFAFAVVSGPSLVRRLQAIDAYWSGAKRRCTDVAPPSPHWR